MDRQKEQLIIKAISDSYMSMHLLDMKKGTYEELYAVPAIHQELDGRGQVRETFKTMLGHLVRSENLQEVLEYMDLEVLGRNIRDGGKKECEFLSVYGGWRRLRLLPVSWAEDGTPATGILMIECIDEEKERESEYRKRLEDAIRLNERLKYVDELTGCLNKQGFFSWVKKKLKKHPERQYVVCYSDISNLGYVNSTSGYEIGNQLLRRWAAYMKESLAEDETFARISGDCFATFLRMDNAGRKQEIEELYEKVSKQVNDYFQQFDRHFYVNIYTGIYMITQKDLLDFSVERMLNSAAIAQKNAKDTGGNKISYFNNDQWERRWRNIAIKQHLSSAIEDGEIEAWIQPQYDYQANKIIGAEVLCRWNSSFMGKISPAEFIPVLEESGQVFELDLFMWEQACKFMRKCLDKEGCELVPLSVNISRRDIMEENLGDCLQSLLKKYDLSPEVLRLEITESAYMKEPEKLIERVQELQNMGFIIEMDDFGSGYSSLNMLKEVPVDILKMDLHFLAHNGQGRRGGGNIISSVIRLAQGLNIAVIAEGVETMEQSDLLKNMGCFMMQGYYFAKPMPMKSFEELLQTEETGKMRGKFVDDNLVYIYDIMDTDSKSSYIFNHFSNASAVLEFDGDHVELMCVNDEYLHTLGDYEGISRQHMKDGLYLVQEEDRALVKEAIYESIEKGRAECEIFLKRTARWVRVTLRHVFKSRSADYFFCEVVNTTEEHRLTVQLNNLMEEVNKQINLLPVGAFRYEADGKQEFAFISDGMLSLLKYPTVEAFRRKFHNNFPEMICAEDRERVLREIDEQIACTGSYDYCEYRIETGDGTLKWVYDHGRLLTDENGKKWFYVVIADLDQVKRERQEKLWQEKKYQTLAMVPGVNMFEYDWESDCLRMDMVKKNGRPRTISIEHYLEQMDACGWAAKETTEVIRKAFEEASQKVVSGSFRYDGRFEGEEMRNYRCFYASVADENGKIIRIVGNAANIEQEAREMSGWRERALRDNMTGLLNHDATIEAIQRLLAIHRGGVLMMLDVDNFKQINDTRGHLFGDKVLKQIAGLLAEKFRKTDVVGRFGGDEFAIFLPEVGDRDFAAEKGQEVAEALKSIEIAENRTVHVSIGIAVDDTGEISAEKLLNQADTLLYDAKAKGKNCIRME